MNDQPRNLRQSVVHLERVAHAWRHVQNVITDMYANTTDAPLRECLQHMLEYANAQELAVDSQRESLEEDLNDTPYIHPEPIDADSNDT